MMHSLLLSSRSVNIVAPSQKKNRISSSGSSSSSSSSAVYSNCNFISKPIDHHTIVAKGCAFDEMRTNSDSEASSAGVAERTNAEARLETDQFHLVSGNKSSSSDEVNGLGGGGGNIAALNVKDLLTDCVMSVCQGKWQRSLELLRVLKEKSSADNGDGGDQRMVSQFTAVLSARIRETSTYNSEYRSWMQRHELEGNIARLDNIAMDAMQNIDEEGIQNASLSFNQVTPYLRFLHLTANQAILEAVERKQRIHVVDIEIMQGLQWPPFMQAMAERDGGPPTLLKITGGGRERRVLEQVGERLRKFAESVGIEGFEYDVLEYGVNNNINSTSAHHGPRLRPLFRSGNEEDDHDDDEEEEECETMVVNCVLQVGDMPWNSSMSDQSVTSLFPYASSNLPSSSICSSWMMLSDVLMRYRPFLVTIAEPEVDFSSSSSFEIRFAQALRHYSAMFESLDATLPPSCQHRAIVENVWLRSQIASLLLHGNNNRNDNNAGQLYGQVGGPNSLNNGCRNGLLYQSFTCSSSWRASLCSRGFEAIPLSEFAISQARLLLRLRYPSEGYRLRQFYNNNNNASGGDQHCLALGWQDTPLFTVSAWKSPSSPS